MANPKKSNATSATPAPAAAPAKATSVAPASAAAPAKGKKETKATPAPASAAPSKVAPAVVATTAASETEGEEKKARRVVSKQSVYADFAALMTRITEEIEKRSPKETEEDASATASKKPKRKKDTGVPLKFLRSINKRLAILQNDSAKMMKLKRESNRDNSKSGLMKPVGISNELFTFLKGAGFDVEKNGQYARVEITRKIHAYVKDKNLRQEKDKRVILPDDKLAKLLKYDAATAKEEMTYFRLPQYLRDHFISEKKEAAAAATTAAKK